jgi:hypothetical protein
VTGTSSLEPGRTLFGRPGGPARLALAAAALLALLTLAVTMARLDLRLAEMVRANEATVDGACRIAKADDRFTRRLQQLDTVAAGGRATLEQTRALRPLLTELRDALRPTAAAVATGRAGAEHSAEQLARIRKVLTGLRPRRRSSPHRQKRSTHRALSCCGSSPTSPPTSAPPSRPPTGSRPSCHPGSGVGEPWRRNHLSTPHPTTPHRTGTRRRGGAGSGCAGPPGSARSAPPCCSYWS